MCVVYRHLKPLGIIKFDVSGAQARNVGQYPMVKHHFGSQMMMMMTITMIMS